MAVESDQRELTRATNMDGVCREQCKMFLGNGMGLSLSHFVVAIFVCLGSLHTNDCSTLWGHTHYLKQMNVSSMEFL